MKGLGEVPQGPVILEVGRLVQKPRRRPARPAAGLEVVFVVEEALEERFGPALGLKVRGDLAGGRDERLAIRVGKRPIGPVIAVVIALHRAGPVFMQRQIETLDRHVLAGQVGKCRSIQERPEPAVPGRPVEAQPPIIPARSAAVLDLAALTVRNAVQDRPMPVGQAVIVAFVFRQAVTVHLGQEAEVIGQREIPDLQARPANAVIRCSPDCSRSRCRDGCRPARAWGT